MTVTKRSSVQRLWDTGREWGWWGVLPHLMAETVRGSQPHVGPSQAWIWGLGCSVWLTRYCPGHGWVWLLVSPAADHGKG